MVGVKEEGASHSRRPLYTSGELSFPTMIMDVMSVRISATCYRMILSGDIRATLSLPHCNRDKIGLVSNAPFNTHNSAEDDHIGF